MRDLFTNLEEISMIKLKLMGITAALVAAAVSGSTLAATITLRAAHQFPGGKGDARGDGK
jgi:hypothetical protein